MKQRPLKHITLKPRETILMLFSDYVCARGKGEIGIGSIIEISEVLGLSQKSIRSAIFRMSRAGMIKKRVNGRKVYYSLTQVALNILKQGDQRIFDRNRSTIFEMSRAGVIKKKVNGKKVYYSLTQTGLNILKQGDQRVFYRNMSHWDGMWTLVLYSIPENKRELRDQLRVQLEWIGFGPLIEAVWITPNDLRQEVEELARQLKITSYVKVFRINYLGLSDPQAIVAKCWNLKRIHKEYNNFITKVSPKLMEFHKSLESSDPIDLKYCFIERFYLTYEYRRFPFYDPDLPVELLPKNWLRSEATDLFYQYRNGLTEYANQYIDSVMEKY